MRARNARAVVVVGLACVSVCVRARKTRAVFGGGLVCVGVYFENESGL